jgi:tetrapyrrole methylase family protein/MazG family protein
MDNIKNNRKEYFEKLYQIIKKLRAPDGCPWDLEQTAATLRKDLLEEVYECIVRLILWIMRI